MRRLLPLALTALTGCYPFLSEEWTSYVEVSDDVQIVGKIHVTDPAGGYWEDGGAAYGNAWWGWLDEPISGTSAISEIYGGDGCRQRVDLTGLLDAFAVTVDDSAAITGPSSFTLDFDDSIPAFYGELEKDDLPVVPDSEPEYMLEEVEVINGGAIAIDRFFTIPAPLEFSGPDMSTDAIPTVAADGMSWTWDNADLPSGTTVVLEVTAVNFRNETVEAMTCVADGREGEISVDEDVWDGADRHAGWYVRLATVSETNWVIEGPDTTSSISGEYARLGFFYEE